MKTENIVLGIVSKGRLLDESIKYLRKRNFKILYEKDKRSLTGKIRGKNAIFAISCQVPFVPEMQHLETISHVQRRSSMASRVGNSWEQTANANL